MLAELVDHVVGIDPDRDWITAAVIDAHTTGVVATERFGADSAGYDEAISWGEALTVEGERAWAIEGTASYGRGFTAALARVGEWVIEFDRPRGEGQQGRSEVRRTRRCSRRPRNAWPHPAPRTACPRRAPRSPACAHRHSRRSRAGAHRSEQRTQSARVDRTRRHSPRTSSPHDTDAGEALRRVSRHTPTTGRRALRTQHDALDRATDHLLQR